MRESRSHISIKKEPSQAPWVIAEILLLVLLAGIMVLWSFSTGEGPGGPDEPMRYSIAQWLYAHPGQLPRGDDPSLLNPIWGLSYAFYPYLSYMICTVFMWAAALVSDAPEVLLHAARLASTVYILIAAVFVMKAGKRLFGRDKGLLFAVLVIFMPGFHFLGTYVNNDSFALMATAIIFYSWALCLDEGWTWRACTGLAIGMGLTLMSYYNAYGWVLFSFFFFVLTVLLCRPGRMGERVKFLFSRGIVISVITLGISAWFFIRNAILYNGDITGRRTATACAEIHAMEDYKPSKHWTPKGAGWSFPGLMMFQLVGWEHNWLILSLISFVGTFGLFDIFMQEPVSKTYLAVLILGFAGMLLVLDRFLWHQRTKQKSKRLEKGQLVVTKVIRIECTYDAKAIFHWMLVGAMLVPIILYCYYAYEVDLQAQGRYFITSVYAIMYFALSGLCAILEKVFRSQTVRRIIYLLIGLAWTAGAVFNYITVIIPAYA